MTITGKKPKELINGIEYEAKQNKRRSGFFN